MTIAAAGCLLPTAGASAFFELLAAHHQMPYLELPQPVTAGCAMQACALLSASAEVRWEADAGYRDSCCREAYLSSAATNSLHASAWKCCPSSFAITA